MEARKHLIEALSLHSDFNLFKLTINSFCAEIKLPVDHKKTGKMVAKLYNPSKNLY